jgi:hypothetical protein
MHQTYLLVVFLQKRCSSELPFPVAFVGIPTGQDSFQSRLPRTVNRTLRVGTGAVAVMYSIDVIWEIPLRRLAGEVWLRLCAERFFRARHCGRWEKSVGATGSDAAQWGKRGTQ